MQGQPESHGRDRGRRSAQSEGVPVIGYVKNISDLCILRLVEHHHGRVRCVVLRIRLLWMEHREEFAISHLQDLISPGVA
jgi:hypothetical protein